MKKTNLIALFFITFCLLFLSVSYAQIPHLINYQGKLTDTDGNPVADGAHSIIFRIYDAEAGGSLLWEETQSIIVQKGVFSCLLGGATNLEIPFDKPYWLAIKVGSDEEMTPRQRITSSGYALRAEYAEDAGSAATAQRSDIAASAEDSEKLGGKGLGELSYEDLDTALQDMIVGGEKTITGIGGTATRRNEWVDLSPEMTFKLLIDRQVDFDADIEIRHIVTNGTGCMSAAVRLLVNDVVVDSQEHQRVCQFTRVTLGSFTNCLQGVNTVKVQATNPHVGGSVETRNGTLTAAW